MPYPNEHACRLRDPGAFQEGRFRRGSRKHDGKTYYVIYGRLKGSDQMTEQAYRYPKDSWSAAEARAHCREHDGSFEAALQEFKKEDLESVEELLPDICESCGGKNGNKSE